MKRQWKQRLACVLAILLGFTSGLGGGTSFSFVNLNPTSLEAPVVAAADGEGQEVTEDAETDTLDLEEPSEEETAEEAEEPAETSEETEAEDTTEEESDDADVETGNEDGSPIVVEETPAEETSDTEEASAKEETDSEEVSEGTETEATEDVDTTDELDEILVEENPEEELEDAVEIGGIDEGEDTLNVANDEATQALDTPALKVLSDSTKITDAGNAFAASAMVASTSAGDTAIELDENREGTIPNTVLNFVEDRDGFTGAGSSAKAYGKYWGSGAFLPVTVDWSSVNQASNAITKIEVGLDPSYGSGMEDVGTSLGLTGYNNGTTSYTTAYKISFPEKQRLIFRTTFTNKEVVEDVYKLNNVKLGNTEKTLDVVGVNSTASLDGYGTFENDAVPDTWNVAGNRYTNPASSLYVSDSTKPSYTKNVAGLYQKAYEDRLSELAANRDNKWQSDPNAIGNVTVDEANQKVTGTLYKVTSTCDANAMYYEMKPGWNQATSENNPDDFYILPIEIFYPKSGKNAETESADRINSITMNVSYKGEWKPMAYLSGEEVYRGCSIGGADGYDWPVLDGNYNWVNFSRVIPIKDRNNYKSGKENGILQICATYG
ncbi:MAG: hypothetical protein IJV04_07265, partial [Lachnospiraceae bacterium]|nr:hypothetical protein [Lachnospiraceae bacterium]